MITANVAKALGEATILTRHRRKRHMTAADGVKATTTAMTTADGAKALGRATILTRHCRRHHCRQLTSCQKLKKMKMSPCKRTFRYKRQGRKRRPKRHRELHLKISPCKRPRRYKRQ